MTTFDAPSQGSPGKTGGPKGLRELRFYWVDVFAERPLEGNPLTVVTDADGLDEGTMKRIAREFNQAETTFLMKPSRSEATYRLRSFTAAGSEVFGAGHNALGAWWLLAAHGHVKGDAPSALFHQEIGDLVLPVEVLFEGGETRGIVMKHDAPSWGATVSDASALAKALGLEARDFDLAHLPAQVLSTGAPHLMVPVRDRRAVDRAQPDSNALRELLRSAGGEGCYLFALDPVDPTSTAYARFFNPTVGITEDSSTGTAAGPLAAYLVAKGLAKTPSGKTTTVRIEQGHAMGRPSVLEVLVTDEDIRLRGRAIVIGEGVLRI